MLARLALRIATICALKEQTIVGDNVLDSQIAALDIAADGSLRTEQDKPFVAVYIDNSKIDDRFDIRGLHKSGLTDLVIEAGIAVTMTETDPETGVSQIVGVGIPATDAAMEFFLDCVSREVVNALTDPNNVWAEIWRGLSSSAVKIERRRTSDASGARIAAHQIVITVDLLPDPIFGAEIAPTSIWARLFDQLEADGHPYLDKMRELVGSADGVLNHEGQRRRFGMTLDEARALLDIPVPQAEATEPDIKSVASISAET